MRELKICFLAENNQEAEKEILSDPAVSYAEKANNFSGAYYAALNHHIDALIFYITKNQQSEFSGLEERLKEIQWLTPPRTAVILKNNGTANLHTEADAVFVLSENETLTGKISEIWHQPIPVLGKNSERIRKNIIFDLLNELEVPEKMKGRNQMADGALLLSYLEQNNLSLNNWLYPQLATVHSTTAGAVERNIRTTIESTWLKGNLENIQKLFGYTVDANRAKPTNAEFLFMLSEHVRRQLKHAGFR